MRVQGAIIASLAVVALVGCDYESPGAVADESIWSAVPAGSSEQQLPEREGRLSDVAGLEARAANLQSRLDRVASRRAPAPETTEGSEPLLGELPSELEAVKAELRALRDLTGDGDAFRPRFERVEAQLADVETRLSAREPPVEPMPRVPRGG